LVSRNHSAAALAELRNIADVDPGYPGINLDISHVLLKSQHTTEANDAIKVQLGISECLSKLPESETQAYCKSQWTSITPEGCRSEVARIHNQAEHQAEMIRMELAQIPDVRSARATMSSSGGPQSLETPPVNAGIPSPTKTASSPQQIAPSVPVVENQGESKPPTATPVVIKAGEASAHIGELATVCGAVVSKKYASDTNGKPTFINLDRPFPDQTFTVVVWGNDLSQTGDLPDNGDLCVTGTVILYRGTPEIVVHDSKDWSRGVQP
jgi:hypothetical protein